jgi:hypothetical protein
VHDISVTPPLPPGNEFVEIGPRMWKLKVYGRLGPLLTLLAALPVRDMEVEEARLEDVVMKYYREGAP